MKIAYSIAAIVALVFLVGGCVNVSDSSDSSTGEKETSKESNDVQSTDQNLKQCDEAINYQVLIDALPKEVNGYVGGEPEGSMLTFTNPADQRAMKYSTAKITLQKDDKNIDVTATDTCYIQFLSMMWVGFYEMEGTDGFLKKATISGYPAWHEFSKPGNTYTYNVFVKERVIVSVQGSRDVADNDVEAATKAVDYSSIAAAAK
jgi:hypothetical protein